MLVCAPTPCRAVDTEMPDYHLQFTVESCLTSATDTTIHHDGNNVTLLFSQRVVGDPYVRVQTEIEAANNRDAQARASTTLLPPILDALAFTTGTPLLLVECELILKDETGSAPRRAIYVGHRKMPTKIALSQEAITEATKVLEKEPLRLPICWHRYALHRQLALDQFIFNWLSFEALAGDADIPSRCPKCGETLEHCGEPVSHRGSSKARAAEIYRSANPETSINEFNNRIWNAARNKVFHGRSYPSPSYLTELASTSVSLRKSAEKQIAQTVEIPNERPYHRYEELFRVFFFIEWNTSDPNRRFATDWPKPVLAHRTAIAELNQVFMEPAPDNLSFLDYAQSSNW